MIVNELFLFFIFQENQEKQEKNAEQENTFCRYEMCFLVQ